MNYPDAVFPDLPKIFRRYYRSKFKEKRPDINLSKISKLRLKIKPDKLGIKVYPQFQYKNTWFVFRDDDGPLIMLLRNNSINGIIIGIQLKVNRVKKAMFDWLKDWQKENRLKIKVDKEIKNEEYDGKKEEKEEKKDRQMKELEKLLKDKKEKRIKESIENQEETALAMILGEAE
jgi:hypothetical protein